MIKYRILETRVIRFEHEIEADSWEKAEHLARFRDGVCIDEDVEYDWDGEDPES